MAKNPRHCVTRPDVFKFPWIVVRPESLLRPGNVYLIVPYRTIHRLVRSLAAANSDSPPRRPLIVSAQTQQQTPAASPAPRRVVLLEGMREESSSVGRDVRAAQQAPMKSCLKKAGCTKAYGKRVAFESPLNLYQLMNE
ncbi:hypothetical protein J5N97_007352 [Dioscorea zingiberensis]|uniref:Uncharacterized protein n=1 Tax=Dioscorea zingiberensis TaxID=325984 RepID=A0A9D5HUG6_9LILI|nr:hypothetical protein J5N97_007352 [Dioscorea zingiberensis]